MNKQPLASILICTDDHPPDLDEFFDSLIFQTVAPRTYEIILVDVNHDTDYEPALERAIKKKHPDLKLAYSKIDKGGRASGYNHALQMSSGRLIIFFGDDYIAPKTLVEAHIEYHQKLNEENKVGIGSAILEEKYRKNPFAVWLEKGGELYGIPFSDDMTSVPENFFYIGNASVKKSFLNKAGIFDEIFPYHAWDDYELGLRLSKNGMVAGYVPGAKAIHHHDISIAERFRTMSRAGECAKLFEKKYPGKHPWQKMAKKPVWTHKLARLKWKWLHNVSNSEAHVEQYYRSVLNEAFSRGYQSLLE